MTATLMQDILFAISTWVHFSKIYIPQIHGVPTITPVVDLDQYMDPWQSDTTYNFSPNFEHPVIRHHN